MQLREYKIGEFVGYVTICREAPIPVDSTARWHVVMPHPSQEKATIKRLEDELDLKAYLPVVHKQRDAGRGRKRDVELPLMPGYFFLRIPEHTDYWRQVRAVRGVADFLLTNERRPAILKSAAVEAIRWKEAQIEQKRLQRLGLAQISEAAIPIGQQVWVEILPFLKSLAKVTGYNKTGHAEVLLEMAILGRKDWSAPIEKLQSIDL